MKSKVLFFLGLFGVSSIYAQLTQADSTYIYDQNGVQHWYHIQKDVYCFKLTNEVQYTGNVNPCVENQEYWQDAPTKFNEINFNPSSSLFDRYNQIVQLQSTNDYEVSSVALTRYADSTYTSQEYYRTDDRIMVTFNDPLLDNATITSFADEYSLELIHEPSSALPNTVSWTYIFRLIPDREGLMTTVRLAQIINENEPQLVKLAEPNMFSVEPLNCQPTTEMSLTPGNVQGTWHIRNTGDVIWNGQSGTNDADADLCECWGAGYTGEGIKMGIIDFGAFEFSHNDFEGSNIPKAYNVEELDYETSNFALNSNDFHAMKVTGIVAATPNNTAQGQRWAVGAAYNTEVIPYINRFTSSDVPALNSQIVQSLQAAVLEGVDVINMSFRTNAAIGSIDIQINNAVSVGRPDPNDPNNYFGIVCVAGVGNNDVQGSNFPANMPNVIGVGWSNPNDYRCSSNPPGGFAWTATSGDGSTYGPPEYNYDVVAPGELLVTTNLAAFGSYDVSALGSSYSTPIVASIAAMILEKNPLLTWSEVRELIRNGAEKVNTNTYDYNMFGNAPGYNNEMFYGRVSCINSINQTLNITEEEKPLALTVMNMGEHQYLVFIPESGQVQPYELYDMSGRLLLNGKATPGNVEIPIDLSAYHSGMYFLKIYNSERTILSTKLMK